MMTITIKWKWEDDEGKVHKFIIPTTYLRVHNIGVDASTKPSTTSWSPGDDELVDFAFIMD
jgi:hypothetical protein